ncbi:MAG: acyltransferase family protein [Clostridia bacterium]|nr:acyltransferase family protein [Clostridia bacterium]
MIEKKMKRISYADAARIAAAGAVVLLHNAGVRLLGPDVGSGDFVWAVFFDAFARWSVPLFIMLSGMLFLNKEKKLDIKRLYKKNILRLVTAFVFWSYIYNVYLLFVETRSVVYSLTRAFLKIPDGELHLWYCYIIVGLYIALPFIKRMTENMTKRETEYFLVLNILLTFLPKTLESFEIFAPFTEFIGKFEIMTAAGYVGLFVAGWYIDNFEHGRLFRVLSYLAAAAGFLYMFLMTVFVSRNAGALDESFMSFKGLPAYLMAFGVMTLFKSTIGQKELKRRSASNLANYAKYMFGVYMIHELLTLVPNALGWVILPNMIYLSIPIHAVIVFAVSLFAAAIIDLTPLGKYLI